MSISLKRAYDESARSDGFRVLVDRLWPRGIRKEDAKIDIWLKDAAPSTDLRKWFHSNTSEWKEFERRYRAELDARAGVLDPLVEKAREGPVTLVYASRDTERNHAVLLKELIERRIARKR